MASTKNNIPELHLDEAQEDSFINKGHVSDMRATRKTMTERDLQRELLNKFDPPKIIDEFEKKMGIIPNTPKVKWQYKNVILEPQKLKDQELLNDLFNDPKFMIITYKDSFSARGDYKAFIIYGEQVNQDGSPIEKKEPTDD